MRKEWQLTELLLDDLEDLLLVKLLGQSLNCSQSFTTIALCGKRMSAYCPDDTEWGFLGLCDRRWRRRTAQEKGR
jgi:hypothetical protein